MTDIDAEWRATVARHRQQHADEWRAIYEAMREWERVYGADSYEAEYARRVLSTWAYMQP